MARQKKIGMDYFSVDVDLFHDYKIRELRKVNGNDGFALFMYLLTQIYKSEYYELDFTVKSSDLMIRTICEDVYISVEKFHEILSTCFEIDLFDENEYNLRNVLTSNGIRRRVKYVEEARAKARERMRKNRTSNSESELSPISPEENKKELFDMNRDHIVNNGEVYEPTADELKHLGMTAEQYHEAEDKLSTDYDLMKAELYNMDPNNMTDDIAIKIMNNFNFNYGNVVSAIVKMNENGNIENKIGYILTVSRRRE